MAKYGAFTVPVAKRIARATKIVEGSPRTYVHVPQRVPIQGRGRQTPDPSLSQASPFTIIEYDATTGDVVATMYRGRNRGASNGSLFDVGLLWSTDNYLYAGGTGEINRDTGCIVKWDVADTDNIQKLWESSDDGGNATVFGSTAVSPSPGCWRNFVEASDGFIWACSGPDGTSYITRTNATTGVQTHSYGTAAAHELFMADNSGGIVIHNPSASPYLRVLDSTATSTATHTTSTLNVQEHEGVLCCTSTSADLRLLNADDLTTIDSLAAPSGTWLGAVSDGTHVYAAYSSNYTKLDATNLAAAAVWTTAKATTNSLNMYHFDGRVYDLHYQTASITTGGIAKINTSTGAVDWNYTTSARVLHDGQCVGFGSNFVVIVTQGIGTAQNIICLDDSTGTVRWMDTLVAPRCVIVTPDDRVFACTQKTSA